MIDATTLTHEFVEFIPDDLKDGTIYVSIRFATVTHQCCCGCGHKVVTPLRPTDWKLVFDGKSVSLDPSIGNWSFPCRSHYWIRNNRVEWAEAWSEDEIQAGRRHDGQSMSAYFGQPEVEPKNAVRPREQPTSSDSFWRRFWKC